MNILAMDTATTALGLCLKCETESRTVVLQAGLKHSEKLMPGIRNLLGEAGLPVGDLDLVVCSTGPGSFTGIRIGLAAAKGLVEGIRSNAGRGKECRLIGVSTLDGLALRYRSFTGLVVAVNPSLRKNYYAAVYREGTREGGFRETTLADLSATLQSRRPLLITGAGAGDLFELMHAEEAIARSDLIIDESGQSCDPAGLLDCGVEKLGEPESEPVPLYLRKSEAEITFFGE